MPAQKNIRKVEKGENMMAKKIHSTWQRQYRERCTAREGEKAFQLVLGESDIRVIASFSESALAQGWTYEKLTIAMRKSLEELRADIASWARLYPTFRTSLAPLPEPEQSPEIIRRMHRGAAAAGVGPFAAVAGTVAHMLAEKYADIAPNLIIENGGDVYMYSTKERHVALLAQPQEEEEAGGNLGLRFGETDFPLALCASSATIGHSLSLGCGELAVVRAREGALADAVATALGNRLRSAQSVQQALDFAQNIVGVEGIFVQCDDAMGVWGAMELVAV